MKRLIAAAAFLLAAVPASAQESGLDLWNRIHEVFSHPRCANCHVGPDNIPVWSGPSYGGEPRPHGMNITGGDSRVGAEFLPCGTCHMKHNAPVPHGPPGAEVWALPPVEMQWIGKTSAEICAQIKDPARNGGRTIAEITDHVDHDELVHWGWTPGPGREPAPYSIEQTVEFLKSWEAAGAPCPAG
jgi:hypothetical protein